jgi:hypothetical protein
VKENSGLVVPACLFSYMVDWQIVMFLSTAGLKESAGLALLACLLFFTLTFGSLVIPVNCKGCPGIFKATGLLTSSFLVFPDVYQLHFFEWF